jgi:hypothetical protein
VCGELDADVTVAPAGATATTLIAAAPGEPGIDAWITVAPWAQITRDERTRAGGEPLLEEEIGPVGRSPIVFVGRRDRIDVLEDVCGGEVTWTCLGDQAGKVWADIGGGETWGSVRPAHAEPETSAIGLLATGQAVGDFVATDAIPVDEVARADWENNDAFAGWFQRLEASIPTEAFAPGRNPFDTWLRTRGRASDVVATIEADAVPRLQGAAEQVREAASVLYPRPVATADVVLVPVTDGRNPAGLEAQLRDVLADAGFRVDGGGPDGAPDLGDTDGLPSAGALFAIQQLWAGVVR